MTAPVKPTLDNSPAFFSRPSGFTAGLKIGRRGIFALAFGAGILMALNGCGHSGGSSAAATPTSTPNSGSPSQLIASQMNPSEVARFEQTLNSVSLAIHWRSPKDAPPPPPTAGAPRPTAQETARINLSNEIESDCEFTPINDDKGPRDSKLDPQLANSTTKNINVGQLIGGDHCPINLRWRNSNYIASVNTTDPKLKARAIKTDFSIHLKPVAKKIQPALDVHEYRLNIRDSSDYGPDSGNLADSAGSGFIDTVSQGKISITMSITSSLSGESLVEITVYKFMYPDGTWYELGETLTQSSKTANPVGTYFLGNNSIDAQTMKRYLFQLGLDQFDPEGVLP